MAAGDPHSGQATVASGQPLAGATAAMVMVHGRGATASSIIELADVFGRPDFAYIAPSAAGNTWYPYSFLAPIEQNEPWLSSALAFVERVMGQVSAAGVPTERTMMLGFSQGACLTLEFIARHARRYGGVVALTGGLIGPDATPREYPGTLAGTPIFIGSADPDPHIPVDRVRESAAVLQGLGGDVTTRIYPGMGHTVNEDEVEQVRAMMEALV